jgi:hypothetical protein
VGARTRTLTRELTVSKTTTITSIWEGTVTTARQRLASTGRDPTIMESPTMEYQVIRD